MGIDKILCHKMLINKVVPFGLSEFLSTSEGNNISLSLKTVLFVVGSSALITAGTGYKI